MHPRGSGGRRRHPGYCSLMWANNKKKDGLSELLDARRFSLSTDSSAEWERAPPSWKAKPDIAAHTEGMTSEIQVQSFAPKKKRL